MIKIHNKPPVKLLPTCNVKVHCPDCGSMHIIKSGLNIHGTQRYRCCNPECESITFMLQYRYKACVPGIKEQIVEMAINGSGIRDTARVLDINKNTVINTLKKKADSVVQVNPNFNNLNSKKNLEVSLELACEVELDEQWSFVRKKSNQCWLWHAVDHAAIPDGRHS